LGDDPVTSLLTRTRNGDRQARTRRRTGTPPLAWSICRRHRLEAADAQHVAQTAWHELADHLVSLPGPAALPGWPATITAANAAAFGTGPATTPGQRMAVVSFPWHAALGTRRHGDCYDFCILHRDRPAVQMDVTPGRFSRLVICAPEGSDPQAEAARTAAAAGIAPGAGQLGERPGHLAP
jgi:hypothetical protein